MTVSAAPSTKTPGRDATARGLGITSGEGPGAALARHAGISNRAANAQAARDHSEREMDTSIVLATIVVERAGLRGVVTVVLQDLIGQVQGIERQTDIVRDMHVD